MIKKTDSFSIDELELSVVYTIKKHTYLAVEECHGLHEQQQVMYEVDLNYLCLTIFGEDTMDLTNKLTENQKKHLTREIISRHE